MAGIISCVTIMQQSISGYWNSFVAYPICRSVCQSVCACPVGELWIWMPLGVVNGIG